MRAYRSKRVWVYLVFALVSSFLTGYAHEFGPWIAALMRVTGCLIIGSFAGTLAAIQDVEEQNR